MTHSMTLPFRPQIDHSRIVAQAGAITVNAVLLMTLLAPMTPPVIDEPATSERPITWIPRQEPKHVEPVRVPIVQQPKRSNPRPAKSQPVAPPVEHPVLVPDGEIAVDPPTEPEVTQHRIETITPPIEPAQGAQLRYRSAPPPPYPREALRDRLTGTVLLEVLVDVDGRPLEANVVQSSGHRVLDQAARRQILARWRFEPAMQNGQAVQALGRVPVEFNLDA